MTFWLVSAASVISYSVIQSYSELSGLPSSSPKPVFRTGNRLPLVHALCYPTFDQQQQESRSIFLPFRTSSRFSSST
ncbi:Protein of unknown function [Pyronema omphalodes CBS 100304]|uniref:Uncharacterized protein n=1 Tax=Pyronema omphalodes (strain CBS 100304) TaxID=1076935 RepID=U4LH11_PYROM|nr:Protein of unknown function [Pyronema omphalodes CBS 100304]